MKKYIAFLLLILACQNEPIETIETANLVATIATATPTTVVGTAEQTVTIEGSGFGSEKGRVYFGNYVAMGGMLYEWTDTKIVAQIIGSNTNTYSVKVTNADGSATLSTANSISMKWGVYTAADSDGLGSYKRYPASYVDLNGKGGVTWHCPIGTSLSAKSTFQSAINYWVDKTGVNWELGEDVNNIISDLNDGVFMIGIEEGAGLARASARATNCGDFTFYISDASVSFDSSPSLNVAKHELGHALLNGHGSGLMCGNTSCLTGEASLATLEACAYTMDKSVNVGVSCYPKMIPLKDVTPPPPQPTLYTFYLDADGDGYGNPNNSITSESTTAPSGYVKNNTDCDDTNPNVNPSMTEIIGNNKDDDCNPRTKDVVKGKGRPKPNRK